MDYEKFIQILNKNLFDKEKAKLLEKIIDRPERYVGLFRPTTSKLKIIQNLLQSREIRFGKAFEEIVREFIKCWGYIDIPEKRFKYNGKDYDLDQYFTDNHTYYFIEQKIRDDHDSTKKIGQMENFKIKLQYLYEKHNTNLVGILYFIDPSLTKNKNYYNNKLKALECKYPGVSLHLFYGKELFVYFNHPKDWENLIKWLISWKKELPEFPEIDFDKDPEDSFQQLKSVNIKYWKKLTEEEILWKEGIIKVISSKGVVLNKIANYLMKHDEFKKIGEKLKERIKEYYNK